MYWTRPSTRAIHSSILLILGLSLWGVLVRGDDLAVLSSGAAILFAYGALTLALLGGSEGITPADGVTVLRGLLSIGGVLATLARFGTFLPWLFLLISALGDFFDGKIARRFGTSPHGALLDMESDGLFFYSWALIGYLQGNIPLLLLSLGLMRPLIGGLYGLIGALFSTKSQTDIVYPPAFSSFARGAAATAMVLAVIAIFPWTPQVLAAGAAGLGTGLVFLSFMIEGGIALHHWRTRR